MEFLLNKSGKLASFRWSHYAGTFPTYFPRSSSSPTTAAWLWLRGFWMKSRGPGWLVGIPRRGRFHRPQNLPILEGSPPQKTHRTNVSSQCNKDHCIFIFLMVGGSGCVYKFSLTCGGSVFGENGRDTKPTISLCAPTTAVSMLC